MSSAGKAATAFLASAIALLVLACTGSSKDAAKFDAATGQHPAGWLQNHYVEFITNPTQCQSCHGSTTDPASTGGISKVSCFSCHPNGPSHQAGWEAANQHGRLGAQATPSNTRGFAYCAKCHGSNYNNPIGTAPSCLSCHTRAPHPNRPWVGTTADQPNHVFSDAGNAPECYKCHANGANSTVVPTTPAPAGTEPGCFNNTMCHGARVPFTSMPGAPDLSLRPAAFQNPSPGLDPARTSSSISTNLRRM